MILRNIIIFLFALLHCMDVFAKTNRADSLRTDLKNHGQDTLRVNTLLLLSKTLMNNEPQSAQAYITSALELSEKLSYRKGKAKSNQLLGELSQDNSNYSAAIDYLKKALEIYSEMRDTVNISECLNKIGDTYWWQADNQRALENYFHALKLNEEMKNKGGIAKCYRNIGWVYYRQQNFSQALSFFEKSLSHFLQTNDSTSIAFLYSDIGAVHGNLKNHRLSLEFFLRCKEILETFASKSALATLYVNLAIAYSNEKEFELAKQYAGKAASIFSELEQKIRIAETFNTLGEIYYKAGQYDSAVYFEEKGLRLSREVAYRMGVKSAYHTLARSFAGLKKYKEAYEYFEKFNELNDSLLSDESIRQVSEMQALYETGKKEKQIELQKLELEKQASDIKFQRILLLSSIGAMLIFLFMAFSIRKQYKEKKNALDELAIQKAIVDQKNKDMTDSINYAQRIQDAVFPDREIKYRIFPDAFVYFRPRDIVSGDFYWYAEKDGRKFIAAVDCTGHGVPGAFMSIIGNHLLNEIILGRSVFQPAEALNQLHEGVRSSLKQDDQKKQADGMDIALLCFNNGKVEYAGASRPLYLVSDSTLREIRPDKFPIGGKDAHEDKKFSNHLIEVKEGDMIYISSDGYADQFGGDSGKKFMTKNFKNLLLSIAQEAPSEQERILHSTFEKWKGAREQVDDVLVIGIKI